MDGISRLVEAYAAAVLAKDVEAFLALYDDEVRVFDLWGRWSYEGIGAWRGMVTGWFGSLGGEEVAVEVTELQTAEAGDLAVAHCFISYQGRSAGGELQRAMVNRMTWVLRSTGADWRIVHEHSSAPVDDATAQVILQR